MEQALNFVWNHGWQLCVIFIVVLWMLQEVVDIFKKDKD
jgi:hypothetical protein